jgi:hypothetical protein
MNNIMRTVAMLFAVIITSAAHAQYNKENLALDQQTEGKFRYKNLQLYPIRANKVFEDHHRGVGTYLSLKEALEKKKIVITEAGNQGSDGSVNTLYAQNISSDTIMILAGEVVQGGKQDRMIGQDIVLYPKSGKKDISVFCVEHGRWQQNGNGMAFSQYFSISNNEVRKAATVKKDQGEVWNKVAETTGKNNANTSSGTLAALKDSDNLTKALAEYKSHFKNLLVNEYDVIGVIAVSGDVILGCDMFATHALFAKHYENLISSYSTEAITSGKPVTISREKVRQYLFSIIEDESKQEQEVEKKGTQLKDKNRKLHISTF